VSLARHLPTPKFSSSSERRKARRHVHHVRVPLYPGIHRYKGIKRTLPGPCPQQHRNPNSLRRGHTGLAAPEPGKPPSPSPRGQEPQTTAGLLGPGTSAFPHPRGTATGLTLGWRDPLAAEALRARPAWSFGPAPPTPSPGPAPRETRREPPAQSDPARGGTRAPHGSAAAVTVRTQPLPTCLRSCFSVSSPSLVSVACGPSLRFGLSQTRCPPADFGLRSAPSPSLCRLTPGSPQTRALGQGTYGVSPQRASAAPRRLGVGTQGAAHRELRFG
jgi:hypothetical protein